MPLVKELKTDARQAECSPSSNVSDQEKGWQSGKRNDLALNALEFKSEVSYLVALIWI